MFVSPLWPSVDNMSFEVFCIYQLESCLCFVMDVAVKLAQVGMGESSWKKLLRATNSIETNTCSKFFLPRIWLKLIDVAEKPVASTC